MNSNERFLKMLHVSIAHLVLRYIVFNLLENCLKIALFILLQALRLLVKVQVKASAN